MVISHIIYTKTITISVLQFYPEFQTFGLGVLSQEKVKKDWES